MRKPLTLSFVIFFTYIIFFIAISILYKDAVLTIFIGAPLLFYIPGKIILNYLDVQITNLVLPVGISILTMGIIYTIINIVFRGWAEFITIAIFSSLSIAYLQKIDPQSEYLKRIFYKYAFIKELSKKDKVILSVSIVFLLLLTSFTIVLISQQNDFEPFSEIYILNTNKNAFDYPNIIHKGSDFTLILGVANNEGRTVSYSVLCFLVEVDIINQTTVVPSSMLFQGQRDVTLDGDSPEIDSRWGGQWESVWTFTIKDVGNYKLYFFLFKDDIPDHLQGLTPNTDYGMTEVSNLLFDTMHSETLSVNLNVEVIE